VLLGRRTPGLPLSTLKPWGHLSFEKKLTQARAEPQRMAAKPATLVPIPSGGGAGPLETEIVNDESETIRYAQDHDDR
jgi:hypothetical protein